MDFEINALVCIDDRWGLFPACPGVLYLSAMPVPTHRQAAQAMSSTQCESFTRLDRRRRPTVSCSKCTHPPSSNTPRRPLGIARLPALRRLGWVGSKARSRPTRFLLGAPELFSSEDTAVVVELIGLLFDYSTCSASTPATPSPPPPPFMDVLFSSFAQSLFLSPPSRFSPLTLLPCAPLLSPPLPHLSLSLSLSPPHTHLPAFLSLPHLPPSPCRVLLFSPHASLSPPFFFYSLSTLRSHIPFLFSLRLPPNAVPDSHATNTIGTMARQAPHTSIATVAVAVAVAVATVVAAGT